MNKHHVFYLCFYRNLNINLRNHRIYNSLTILSTTESSKRKFQFKSPEDLLDICYELLDDDGQLKVTAYNIRVALKHGESINKVF